MRLPDNFIREVVDRTDIEELVGRYVTLKRAGANLLGLCPFHSEKTPSFTVTPAKKMFYCFGCHAGGDAITFVRKINNLDYVEAVKALAGRAGMPMPEEDDKAGRLRSRILNINRDAARFFYAQLTASNEEARRARAYWKGRGLSDSTIRRFGLGYAPTGFHACREHLKSLGYTDEELLASGIILPALPYFLSFAAGAMLYVVVEELIPEMSEGEHSHLGTIAFAVGFSLMIVLDVVLG